MKNLFNHPHISKVLIVAFLILFLYNSMMILLYNYGNNDVFEVNEFSPTHEDGVDYLKSDQIRTTVIYDHDISNRYKKYLKGKNIT